MEMTDLITVVPLSLLGIGLAASAAGAVTRLLVAWFPRPRCRRQAYRRLAEDASRRMLHLEAAGVSEEK